MVFSAIVDTQRLAASGSARCYRQILRKKDDYPGIEVMHMIVKGQMGYVCGTRQSAAEQFCSLAK